MPRFRKKPVVIEAMRYDDTNYPAIFDWMAQFITHGAAIRDGRLLIHTLEGDMEATPGDWVIRGVRDEIYPCKPDIFEATYEPVD